MNEWLLCANGESCTGLMTGHLAPPSCGHELMNHQWNPGPADTGQPDCSFLWRNGSLTLAGRRKAVLATLSFGCAASK